MQHRTRVKFCGITRFEDARMAVELGVDALGFVFYEGSPRYITADAVAAIIKRLPPLVSTVGLFVDAPPARITQVLATAGIDIIQFHGNETANACGRFGRPYVKAIRMSTDTDLREQTDLYPGAAALLLDTYDPNQFGGTGAVFDWAQVPADVTKPIILAGGLDPSNVARAIDTVNPFALDVSSGIEQDKGVKDPNKMQRFMHEVRNCERQAHER